ncbi:MAG: NUDIX domain-containing protein [Pirellulales bacterium]
MPPQHPTIPQPSGGQHFSVAADVVLLRPGAQGPQVLLVRRRNEPFAGRWALPGGFVEIDEPLEQAARRELKEETGVEAGPLEQFGTYGDPGRDPRGRVVSVVFWGWLGGEESEAVQAGSDAADVAWFDLADPPPLAFDHAKILARAQDVALG